MPRGVPSPIDSRHMSTHLTRPVLDVTQSDQLSKTLSKVRRPESATRSMPLGMRRPESATRSRQPESTAQASSRPQSASASSAPASPTRLKESRHSTGAPLVRYTSKQLYRESWNLRRNSSSPALGRNQLGRNSSSPALGTFAPAQRKANSSLTSLDVTGSFSKAESAVPSHKSESRAQHAVETASKQDGPSTASSPPTKELDVTGSFSKTESPVPSRKSESPSQPVGKASRQEGPSAASSPAVGDGKSPSSAGHLRDANAGPSAAPTTANEMKPPPSQNVSTDASSMLLELGDRVVVLERFTHGTGPQPATVRFTGETGFSHGFWIGVEADNCIPKGNDGAVLGKRYFQCAPQHGLFVRRTALEVKE